GETDTGPLGNDLRQRRTLDLQDHAGVVGAARSPARGLPARLQLQGRWRDHQGAVPGNAYTVGPLLRREAPEAYFLRHLEALPGTLQCATDQGLGKPGDDSRLPVPRRDLGFPPVGKGAPLLSKVTH